MFAGCVRTGGWFVALIVIVNVRVEVWPFAVAVTDAENVPEVPSGGARWMLPERVFPTCALEVTVMKAGPENVNVIASPSGSVALIT